MNYHSVIFDLYGTLVPGYARTSNLQSQARIAEGLGLDGDVFADLWNQTYEDRAVGRFATWQDNVRHICDRLGVEVSDAQLDAGEAIRMEAIRRSLTPKPGCLDVLAAMKQAGLKLGLVSDCTPEIPAAWPDTALAKMIDVPVFSATAGMKKPDPRIYRVALDALGHAPAESLFVGDGGSSELTGAVDVGMDAVLVRIPYEDSYEPHRPEVDNWTGPAVVDLAELLEMVGLDGQPRG